MEKGKTYISLKIEKIGMKDATDFMDPYLTVSVKVITDGRTKPLIKMHGCILKWYRDNLHFSLGKVLDKYTCTLLFFARFHPRDL